MKKGIVLSFWSIINRGCDRIDFLSIIGITGDVYEKAEKNDMRAVFFRE